MLTSRHPGRPPIRPRFFYGWIIVAVGFSYTFIEASVFNPVLSVFLVPLEAEFGWTRTEISAAAAIGPIAGALVAPLIGPRIDRVGPRPFMVFGGLVFCAGVVSLAFVQELWQFYLGFGIGRAVVMSTTNAAESVAIANWFLRRRGTAMGITLLGERVGQTVLPLVLTALIVGAGWRYAWLVAGLLGLVMAVLPAALLIRTRPEDHGLLPDGQRAELGRVVLPPEPRWTWRQAARTPTFWLLTAALSLLFFIAAGLNLHVVAYWRDGGMPPEETALALALYSIVAAGGSVFWGWVNDRVGIRFTHVACAAGCGISIPVLLAGTSLPVALAYGVIFGLCLGGVFALAGVLYPSYFGRAAQGAIRGLAVPFFFGGNALGPLAAGAARDASGSYTAIFASFAVLCAIAALCAGLATRPKLPQPPQA